MKKVAIMQPYLFPYIGYFQLIDAADEFIIYDNVQWIKGGWINRNRILTNNGPEYISLPVKKDSYKKNINERRYSVGFEDNKRMILDRVEDAYEGAPYFTETYQIIQQCFNIGIENVAQFNTKALQLCCEYLGITTTISVSSEILGVKNNLRGQHRVIDIAKTVGARHYINAIGGRLLYDNKDFANNGLKLSFLETRLKPYKQFGNVYTPGMSIIDIMMFNSLTDIKTMLNEYDLVKR